MKEHNARAPRKPLIPFIIAMVIILYIFIWAGKAKKHKKSLQSGEHAGKYRAGLPILGKFRVNGQVENAIDTIPYHGVTKCGKEYPKLAPLSHHPFSYRFASTCFDNLYGYVPSSKITKIKIKKEEKKAKVSSKKANISNSTTQHAL